MCKPYHLKCLPESMWWVFRNHAAVFCNGQKFFFPFFIGTGSCLTLCLLCHPVCICDQALALDDACFPVINLLLIFFSGADGVVNISLALLHVTTDSNGQKFFMVTSGLAGNTVSQTNGNDIVLNTLLNVCRKCCLRQILHGFSFPVWQKFQNLLPVFRGNVVRIFASYRKFINIALVPGTGLKLRMKVRTSVFVCGSSDDQFIFHDQRRHALHNVIYNFCPENRNRVTGKLLVRFGFQL